VTASGNVPPMTKGTPTSRQPAGSVAPGSATGLLFLDDGSSTTPSRVSLDRRNRLFSKGKGSTIAYGNKATGPVDDCQSAIHLTPGFAQSAGS
jgi:hypothetical protein